jgi:hypothetical protein
LETTWTGWQPCSNNVAPVSAALMVPFEVRVK